MHDTPTDSSGINQVERWFAEFTRQFFERGVHRGVQALERDVRGWIANWNGNPKPFVWSTTAERILWSVQPLIKRIHGAGPLNLNCRGSADRGQPAFYPRNLWVSLPRLSPSDGTAA
jgi:hypothetical protein